VKRPPAPGTDRSTVEIQIGELDHFALDRAVGVARAYELALMRTNKIGEAEAAAHLVAQLASLARRVREARAEKKEA
jgi:hypothetical protein